MRALKRLKYDETIWCFMNRYKLLITYSYNLTFITNVWLWFSLFVFD